MIREFKLSDTFIDGYKDRLVNWGPLGEFTYLRTYSRLIEEENRKEQWFETVRRVVEGTFTIQKKHCDSLKLLWNNAKAQKSAQKMYDKIFNFKFLPPGRGLWMMGTDFVEQKGGAALMNCAFISTEDIETRGSFAFCWTMDALMLGVGVGFDIRGANKIIIKKPKDDGVFQIPDSREGWVESQRLILEAFFEGKPLPTFDYSIIRPYGSPIKGFGGVASGPEPLIKLHVSTIALLTERIGQKLRSVDIVDIMNFEGVCVVSGNVRRSAESCLGPWTDTDYVTMKDYRLYGDKLKAYRHASNNSIFAEVGKTNYNHFAESIALNGEPGLVWIENIRKYGRLGDAPDYADSQAMGLNPCFEQILENAEMCVSGYTKIQTRTGVYSIDSLVGKSVDIWNGEGWSTVVPFETGVTDLYRVTLSDGSYLDTTKGHGWHVLPQGKKTYRRIKTENLPIGSKSIEYSLGSIEGIEDKTAYELGLFAGDGYISNNIPYVALCGNKRKLQNTGVQGFWGKEQYWEDYSEPLQILNLKGVISQDIIKELNDKEKGLPKYLFEMNKSSILQFIAGWIETDGSVMKQTKTEGYRIYGTEKKMRDLLLLLRRVRINHASIRLIHKSGVCEFIKGRKINRNYDNWYCQIPTYECGEIPTRIKKITLIGNRYKDNNAHIVSEKIDAARKQKIVSIEKLPKKEMTYCFTEPKKGMGVFGTVLTYQCNLVETFPSRHDSYDEYEDTLKSAYLYAKTVTLCPTHWAESNAIMLKNRRIGLSQSGIIEAFIKHGRRNILNWNEKGYQYIKKLDVQYSDWLCIPRSKRVTSVKPSGTVSLLPGVTPGIHYPHSEYYIRRIRIPKDHPLVSIMRKSGYAIHKEAYGEDKEKTLVIDFPIHEPIFTRGKADVSLWEQVKNAVDYQRIWADNSVSITVTFNKDEIKDIPNVLYAYEDSLKAISFLPNEDSGYELMPYETITKEKFEAMTEKITKPDFSTFVVAGSGERYCDSDHCTI